MNPSLDGFIEGLVRIAQGAERVLVLGPSSPDFAEACASAGLAIISLPDEMGGVFASREPRLPVSQRSRAELERKSGEWLTVALGVLEQAPLTHVATVLFNLAQLTKDRAFVSVSTRPRGEEGGSLLPKATWVKLLTMAGFDVVETLRRSVHHPVHPPRHGRFMPWVDRLCQETDPFGDTTDQTPLQLVLTKSRTITDSKAFRATVEELLDVAYIRQKRKPSTVIRRRVILNIHHVQDFLHLRPIVDLIDRDAAESVALLRECVGTTPMQRVLISQALRALGSGPIDVRRAI